jgi:hypothetical protein
VILRWNELPRDNFSTKLPLGKMSDTPKLKEKIARFVHEYKAAASEPKIR